MSLVNDIKSKLLDLKDNRINGIKFYNQAEEPTDMTEGDFWYDSVNKTMKNYNAIGKFIGISGNDGSTPQTAVHHPDELANLGLDSGEYYVYIQGSAKLLWCELNYNNKNYVKLDENFFKDYLTPVNTVPAGDVNFSWLTLDLDGEENDGPYMYGYCSDADYEMWSDFTINDFDFRYFRAENIYCPMRDAGTPLDGANPDNSDYDSFSSSDKTYSNIQGNGADNKSFQRFGVANVFHLAYTDLGWDGQTTEVQKVTTEIANNLADGIKQIDGDVIDMGSVDKRTIRFSFNNESGDPDKERYAWRPSIWIS